MRVLLADDQIWLRSAMRLLLEEEPSIEIVAEVSEVDSLLTRSQIIHPDLILLDWELPGLKTLSAHKALIKMLRANDPAVRIIALSGHPEAGRSALAAGADSFVSKTEPPEHLLEALNQVQLAEKMRKPNMAEYDVVVIGGGPAGLAATFYALQAQLNVALIAPDLGGKVSYPFELRGMPPVDAVWGADLVHQFETHITHKLKNHLRQEVKKITERNGNGFELVLADDTVVGARTLIICTGAHPQRLFVEGEKEYFGRGVSFSAVSHAQFFQGRNVAIIGGERSLPAALKLGTIANRVYFVVANAKLDSHSRIAETVLRNPKVYIFRGWEVQRINGDDFVTSLDLVDDNGETRTLAVEGIFVEFGLLPNNELVQDLVAMDEDGHILVNQRCETNVPGLFAAGDVTNVHAEQVAVALGEGAKAALSAWSYLAANA